MESKLGIPYFTRLSGLNVTSGCGFSNVVEEELKFIMGLLLLYFLLFVSMLFLRTASQTATVLVPTFTAEISPVNSSVQWEGDTVSLLCRVDNFDAERVVLGWSGAHINTFSSADAPFTQGIYSSTFESVDPSYSSYIFNLTIRQLVLADNETYDCNLLEKVSENGIRGIAQLSLVLRVYPHDAFLTCKPADRSSVVVGSQLECQTNGAATPRINGSNDGLTSVMLSNGQVLNKNATLEDNDRTFVCSAITSDTSRMPLSCNIGPLTVVESLPLSTHRTVSEEVTVSPVGTTISNAGLSAAAISGIVVAAVVLIILIAIHTFCCHCNPKKWMNAKSYNLCNSDETGNQETNSTRRQTEVEMGGSRPYEEPDVPPAYFNEALRETHSNLNAEAHQPGTSCKNVSSPSKNTNPAKHTYYNAKKPIKDDDSDNDDSSAYEAVTNSSKTGLKKVQQASQNAGDSYMELNLADRKPSEYAKLKV